MSAVDHFCNDDGCFWDDWEKLRYLDIDRVTVTYTRGSLRNPGSDYECNEESLTNDH